MKNHLVRTCKTLRNVTDVTDCKLKTDNCLKKYFSVTCFVFLAAAAKQPFMFGTTDSSAESVYRSLEAHKFIYFCFPGEAMSC